jgi:GNAT superfamily N-acetyltransferase
MAHVPEFRPIVSNDIDQLATMVADAFACYRAFAPADWEPPPANEQVRVLQDWIADPDFWGELASEKQTLIGHATVIPASRHSLRAVPDPALAHLGHLFIKPRYWGSGVAAQLLARAVTAAAREFGAMRLFVPAGHARARGFYTREGFSAIGEPFDPGLGLLLLEYRRSFEHPTAVLGDSPRRRVDVWREVYEGWARDS